MRGATPKEWAHFELILGLTEDLLPVVSNQQVPISQNSKMKGLGKTPSTINNMGFAVGFPNWTQHHATAKQVKQWSANPNLGICLQTRNTRALDIDVTDPEEAAAISSFILTALGDLPTRYRENSSKLLFLLDLPGDYHKRAFKTKHGIVEFLATGQQCIIAGTHTSGVPYLWAGGLPTTLPTISDAQFEDLWTKLVANFAVEPATQSSAAIKQEVLNHALSTDPIAVHLGLHSYIKSTERDGRLHIECPFAAEHTGPSSDSATTYFPANTGGFALGHFDCKHAHCQHRTDDDFKNAIGYLDIEFEDLTEEASSTANELTTHARFDPVHVADFASGTAPSWLIKGLIPRAELVVMFGASGSGKSFMALDLAACVAQGEPWRGLRTKKGTVVYIAAEGAGGYRNRLKAYSMTNGTPLESLDIYVIAASPNFLDKADPLAIAKAILPLEPILVIVDTWAQVTAGGNENSGEDMGKALKNCKGIHTATGATVMLIHHSGKNATMGARGWSGLRAAADAELEVLRNGDDRVLSSTKQKDGEDGAEYGFRLNVVPIGLDEDGDAVTSCVVEVAEVKENTRKVMSLGDNEKVILRVAGELVGLDGALPDHNSVIDAAILEIPFDASTGKNDQRRGNLRRAMAKLSEKGMLNLDDGRVLVC